MQKVKESEITGQDSPLQDIISSRRLSKYLSSSEYKHEMQKKVLRFGAVNSDFGFAYAEFGNTKREYVVSLADALLCWLSVLLNPTSFLLSSKLIVVSFLVPFRSSLQQSYLSPYSKNVREASHKQIVEGKLEWRCNWSKHFGRICKPLTWHMEKIF